MQKVEIIWEDVITSPMILPKSAAFQNPGHIDHKSDPLVEIGGWLLDGVAIFPLYPEHFQATRVVHSELDGQHHPSHAPDMDYHVHNKHGDAR